MAADEAMKAELQKTDSELQQMVTDVQDWAAAAPNEANDSPVEHLQCRIEGLLLGYKQRRSDLHRVSATTRQKNTWR